MPYIKTGMPPITDVESLRRWVDDEFTRLAQGLQTVTETNYVVLYAAPLGPAPGMLVFADGTSWNPGSGRGLYEYRTSSWVKL